MPLINLSRSHRDAHAGQDALPLPRQHIAHFLDAHVARAGMAAIVRQQWRTETLPVLTMAETDEPSAGGTGGHRPMAPAGSGPAANESDLALRGHTEQPAGRRPAWRTAP
jgi:hypothetical protein